jgi:hypothetical protein
MKPRLRFAVFYLHTTGMLRFLPILGALALAGCVHVTMDVHATVDVNVKVDKALDDIFSDIYSGSSAVKATPTQPK